MPEFEFSELLPLADDATPYRKLTGDHVGVFSANGHRFVEVAPEALTLLTREAMRDIAHLLRPGHLAQLRKILNRVHILITTAGEVDQKDMILANRRRDLDGISQRVA